MSKSTNAEVVADGQLRFEYLFFDSSFSQRMDLFNGSGPRDLTNGVSHGSFKKREGDIR